MIYNNITANQVSYRLHALHFRYTRFHDFFNSSFEGNLRERTAAACAQHPHIADIILKFYKLNIAQMSCDKRTDFLKRLFYFFLDRSCIHLSTKLSKFIFLNKPVYKFPVDIFKKHINIRFAARGKIEEVGMLIHIHDKKRDRIPHAALIM